MYIKTYTLLLLFLQFTSSLKVIPKVINANPMLIPGEDIGEEVDLTKAIITYEKLITIGRRNKMVLKTNPPVSNAVIFMNVTDDCEVDAYFDCKQWNMNKTYLTEPMNVKLRHKGEGVYVAEYTIRNKEVGEIRLTFYTFRRSLTGLMFDNPDFIGAPIKRVFSSNFNVNWANNSVLGKQDDYVGIRWKGKWIFPETGSYKMHIVVDDRVRIYVNGTPISNSSEEKNGQDYFVTVNMTKGEYPVVIEFMEFDGNARFHMNCIHPKIQRHNIAVGRYFRTVDSIVISDLITATCPENHFLARNLQKCAKCASGRYQPELGKTYCLSRNGTTTKP